MQDVASVGGWKDLDTLLQVYQQPDETTPPAGPLRTEANMTIEYSRGSEAAQPRTLRSALLTTFYQVGARGFAAVTSVGGAHGRTPDLLNPIRVAVRAYTLIQLISR
jgi:hypothetical protein